MNTDNTTEEEATVTGAGCCEGMGEYMKKLFSNQSNMADCRSMLEQMKDAFCGADGMPDFEKMKQFMQSRGTQSSEPGD